MPFNHSTSRLDQITGSLDIRERIRLIDALEQDDDSMDEPEQKPESPDLSPKARVRMLLWANPPAAELVVTLLSIAWGLALLTIPGMFATTPTLYEGTADLADQWIWGVLLLASVACHMSGYIFNIAKMRYAGVALATGIWGVAAIAQLGSHTLSPTPTAMTVILFWIFLRLPPNK